MARRRKPKLTDGRLEAIAAAEVKASVQYDRTQLAKTRRTAIEYIEGKMTDWPAEANRSSVVSMTTLDTISWTLPGIIRLFTASNEMVLCEPVEKTDEPWAKQATIGLNYTFWKKNSGYAVLYDTTFNSLLHGDGIVKHWWDDTPEEKISFHSGLTEEQLHLLLTPDDDGKNDQTGEPYEEIELLDVQVCEYSGQDYQSGSDVADEPDAEGMAQGTMPSEQPAGLGDAAQAPAPLDTPPGMESAPGAPQAAPGPVPGQMDGQAPMPGAPEPAGEQQGVLYDAKIKRTYRHGRLRFSAIAPENFVISANSTSIDDARLVGDCEQLTRSDLIEMGFDPKKVAELSAYTATNADDNATQNARDDAAGVDANSQPFDNEAMEIVWLYELYLKIDVDGDGIAETIQMHYCDSGAVGVLLDWQVWEDEVVYSQIPCYRMPHRWNSNSLFTRTKDIQEITTVLQRQALDSLYGAVDPQKVVVGRCLNPDELTNPSFGGSIMMEEGGSVTPFVTEFVGAVAIDGIRYFDEVLEKRTGVSRTTTALDPEALQNTTATASQLAHDAAYSQVELMARNMSELGWKHAFTAALKLMIRHQRRKITVRLQNKSYTEIDPRHWNADMDVEINTGLGTGSRDRDIAVLSTVNSNQVAIAQILREAKLNGIALKMVPMIINTLRKSAEAAGVKNVDDLYPEVTEDDLAQAAQAIQQAQGQPPPEVQLEQMKAQTAQQTEQAKAQAAAAQHQRELEADLEAKRIDAQLKAVVEKVKSDAQVTREKAQLEADLVTKEKDRQNQLEVLRQEQGFQAKEKVLDRELQWRIEVMKVNKAAEQAQAKTAADAKKSASDSKNRQNEMRIAAGKDPVQDGIVPQDMLAHMEQLVTALTAPKEIVRDANGRAIGTRTVTQ